jgi:hypothetical protein
MKYARRRICSSDGAERFELARDFAVPCLWRRVLFVAAVFRKALLFARAAEVDRSGLTLSLALLTSEAVTLSFWTSLDFFGTE